MGTSVATDAIGTHSSSQKPAFANTSAKHPLIFYITCEVQVIAQRHEIALLCMNFEVRTDACSG